MPKGYKLSERSYWLNNLWGRIEFSPKGWGEGKKNNTTFGKKVFVLGLSAAGFWNLKANTPSGKRDLKILAEEFDLFFRSPRWEMGRFTLLGEYESVFSKKWFPVSGHIGRWGGISSDAVLRIPKKFGGNYFLESQKVETIF